MFDSLEDANVAKNIIKRFETFAFPDNESLFFAFFHKPQFPPTIKNGWEIYNPLTEYKRMGVDFSSNECPFKLFKGNINWAMTATYPEFLVVPKIIPDEIVIECSKFRTKERIPVLTYYYHPTGASIWRSSQPKVFYSFTLGRTVG